MTTVLTLSLEQLANLPCCIFTVKLKGLNERYVGDAAIRYYQERSIVELQQDLQISADEFVIKGGIGVLILRKSGNEYHPAQTFVQKTLNLLTTPISLPADAATIEARRRICKSCAFFVNGTCNQCGCKTQAKTTIQASKCPLEKW